MNRPMNYPRIWSLLSYFGFGKSHTFVAGIVLGLLFFTVCLNYIGSIAKYEFQKIGFYALVFCSPVIVLLVERGNTDIVIFVLLIIAIGFRNNINAFLIFTFIATVLKLYPLFVFILKWSNNKKEKISLFLFFAVIVFYLVFKWQELMLVSAATPREVGYSYGMNVIFMGILKEFSIENSMWFVKISPIIVALILILFTFWNVLKQKSKNVADENKKHGFGLLVGSLAYCTSFLIGNNFDYRLCFLILTLPFFYQSAESEKRIGIYKSTVLLMLFFLWSPTIRMTFILNDIDFRLFIIEELVSWFLFYMCLAQLIKWLVYRKFKVEMEGKIAFFRSNTE